MNREDILQVVTGRTRVRRISDGKLGTIIAPLPRVTQDAPGNPIVQFDGDNWASDIMAAELEVVSW